LISRHLEQEGWTTVQASNATDALQLARESRPMLITLDIMMPDASGWWVLEKLKEDPVTAGIPVLVVTIVEDQRLVFALGASDYLAKPYDRGHLIGKIHRLLPKLDGKRVLVVDDDPEARTILERILKDEKADVVLAANGGEAMAAIAQATPDLVLLDLMMPGMSGFEVVARLRAQPKGSEIPVMIVSAKELTAEDMLTLNGHVQRFVAKGSIEPEGLANAVRQLLGQSKTQGAAA
jgi:CheY-like chemotaxis protein